MEYYHIAVIAKHGTAGEIFIKHCDKTQSEIHEFVDKYIKTERIVALKIFKTDESFEIYNMRQYTRAEMAIDVYVGI